VIPLCSSPLSSHHASGLTISVKRLLFGVVSPVVLRHALEGELGREQRRVASVSRPSLPSAAAAGARPSSSAGGRGVLPGVPEVSRGVVQTEIVDLPAFVE
jgi:hypothetical protein